ncbi:hypothetical protein Tco_0947013 [Tanacetum coccineum]
MIKRNRGGHLIRRFTGRGNEPDPRDVKIASSQSDRSRTSSADRGERPDLTGIGKTLNGKKSIFRVVCDRGIIVRRFGRKPYEYPFVDIYPNFQKEENNVSFLSVVLGVEEESMPVYDTDIEDVIEEKEGFVRKGGFGRKEDNIKDV